jgi:hypothetical protein
MTPKNAAGDILLFKNSLQTTRPLICKFKSQSFHYSREPLSLARMGQRFSAQSVFDISDKIKEQHLLGTTSFKISASTTAINGLSPTTKLMSMPRLSSSSNVKSQIPTTSRFKKTNSNSSTATTASMVSSPDRSLTSSPVKSRSSASVMTTNNNPGGSSSNNAGGAACPGGDDSVNNNSPNKSRIPILRSASYKIPKTVCFGKSSNRAFSMRHWYQSDQHHGSRQAPNIRNDADHGDVLEGANFEEDMKMALG